jgi:hypothetical protein
MRRLAAALLPLLVAPLLTAQDAPAKAPSARPEPAKGEAPKAEAEARSVAARERARIPLRVQLVINRAKGDKVVSRIPLTFHVATNSDKTSLRMGIEVPVPVTTFNTKGAEGAESGPATSYQYRNAGLSVECSASPEGNRYRLHLSLEESGVDLAEGGPEGNRGRGGPMPRFRTLRSSGTLILHDGQSAVMVGATDPVTGETATIDVTLKVLD